MLLLALVLGRLFSSQENLRNRQRQLIYISIKLHVCDSKVVNMFTGKKNFSPFSYFLLCTVIVNTFLPSLTPWKRIAWEKMVCSDIASYPGLFIAWKWKKAWYRLQRTYVITQRMHWIGKNYVGEIELRCCSFVEVGRKCVL